MAYENGKPVWFDDLRITHQPALIVQENHYYPFGLNLIGIEKQGAPDHKFQYNRVEKEESFGLNWIEIEWRGYDVQIGRFHQIDKLSESMTIINPYQYSFNNPIRLSDPTGLEPRQIKDLKGNLHTITDDDVFSVYKADENSGNDDPKPKKAGKRVEVVKGSNKYFPISRNSYSGILYGPTFSKDGFSGVKSETSLNGETKTWENIKNLIVVGLFGRAPLPPEVVSLVESKEVIYNGQFIEHEGYQNGMIMGSGATSGYFDSKGLLVYTVTTIITQTELKLDKEIKTTQFATVRKFYYQYTSKFGKSELDLIKAITVSESIVNQNVTKPKSLEERVKKAKRQNLINFGANKGRIKSETFKMMQELNNF